MRKDARKEKKKAGEIAKAQRSTTVDEESTSGGVSEEGKIPYANLKTLTGEEWD